MQNREVKLLRLIFSFIIPSLIFSTPAISNESMIITKTRGTYGIINKGENQNVKAGQNFHVIRETAHSISYIGKVKVILTRANLSGVEQISAEANSYIQNGDKVYPKMEMISTSQGALASGGSSPLSRLRPGMWMTVRGPAAEAETPTVATKIEEVKYSAESDFSKLEITAQASLDLTLQDEYLQVLDHFVNVSDKTRFENSRSQEIPRFNIHKGDWLKVKVRIKDGTLFARAIRQIEPRNRFKVFGQVRDVAIDENSITVGAVKIATHPRIDVGFLGEDRSEDREGSPLDRFMQNEQKSVHFSIKPAENIFLGGQMLSKSTADDERDLRRERRRDKQTFSGEFKLDLLWRMNNRGSHTFVEGVFNIQQQLRNEIHEETTYAYKLSQAYYFGAFSKFFSIQLGRQDFDDEREWLYDEKLDGLRFRTRSGPFQLEISGSTTPRLLSQQSNSEETRNITGLLRCYLNPDHFLSAYVVHRAPANDGDFAPRLFGLRWYNKPSSGFCHWLELARAEGRDGFKRIDGYAVDGGVCYIFDTPFRHAITVAAAYATGANDKEDQRSAFRQTGLQDNNARFGGVTSFHYYGEVFDPELSNRLITTVGIGVRPLINLSIDLVFHTYYQDKPSTDLGDTRLRASPTGESKELGREIDLVMGYRLKNWAAMELVLGRFEPGRAFERKDPAHIAELQIRMKF